MSLDRFGKGLAVNPGSAYYYELKKMEVPRCEDDSASAEVCVQAILKFHNSSIPIEIIRARLGSRSNSSLLDIARCVEPAGLITHSFGVQSIGQLRQVDLPAVTNLNRRFVVILKIVSGQGLVIFDPIRGFRLVDFRELSQVWSGQVLGIRNEDTFYKETRERFEEQTTDNKEAQKEQEKSQGLWSRLRYLKLFSNSGTFFFNVAVLSLLLFGLGIIGPRLNQLILDTALVHHDIDLLQTIVLGLVLVNVTTLIFSSFRSLISSYVANFLDYRITTLFYRHALGIAMSGHNKNRVGTMTSYFGELGNLRSILTGEALNLAFQILSAIVFSLWLFSYSWKVGILPFIAAPIVFLIAKVYGGIFRKIYRESFKKSADASSALSEQLEGISSIKSIGAEAQACSIWERHFVDKINLQKKSVNYSIAFGFISNLVQESVRIAGYYIAVRLALGGELSIGGVLAVSQYLSNALGPIMGLASYLDEYQQASITFEKLDEVFSKPITKETRGYNLQEPDFKGDIEFKKVGFRYNNDGPWVLKDISLKIPKGKVTAVVGRSGSGKTTFAKLIPRLLEPTEGDILYDGIEAKTISPSAIRRQTGMVLQDSHLMAGSIVDNIAFSDDSPDPKKLVMAAKLSGAWEFIEKMPTKFDSYLSEGGMGLSGGQKQRVSIARTLYRDPRVLIFDEATSALDAESEKLILDQMDKILEGRTAVVIAHRLNTVITADQIVVMEEGKVVEVGSHSELLSKQGFYANLFKAQIDLMT